MQTTRTLYNLLNLSSKIENLHIRLMYLKDVWGLEQTFIGELEGVSQSYVSRELIEARKKVSRETFIQATEMLFTGDEIKFIQYLPREILSDMQCLAFIQDILGINPLHPFFMNYTTSENVRIAALASMGIQNKRLMEIFNKNQPTVSMIVKRSMERAIAMERTNRYDVELNYRFEAPKLKFTFRKAGGIE
jgi:predicted DNA-binding protein (UPF0251 family)